MAHAVKVVATFKPNPNETFQCVVSLAAFPDAIDEARAQAVRGVHEMVADALKQFTPESDQA